MIVNTCSSLVSTWEICINWIVSEDLILAEWLHAPSDRENVGENRRILALALMNILYMTKFV